MMRKKNCKFIIMLVVLFLGLSGFGDPPQPKIKEYPSSTVGSNLVDNRQFAVSFRKEKSNLKYVKVISISKKANTILSFKTTFQIKNPEEFIELTIKNVSSIKQLTLNGKKIPFPMKKMIYTIIPGIPVSMLNKGLNTLEGTIKVRANLWTKTDNSFQFDASKINIKLLGLTSSSLLFQSGPILGHAGTDYFTIACRTNMVAEVLLLMNNKEYFSKTGLLHSFKIEGLKPNTTYQYTLKSRINSKDKHIVSVGPYSVKTYPINNKNYTFAVLGDSRTYPKDWQKVASALAKHKPLFSLFSGDMVTNGLIDAQWDYEFFNPAVEYFANIPFYAVIGNHERNAPLFDKIFNCHDGNNWSENIGSALIIVIDGSMDWKEGGKLNKWLDNLLAKSNAKFIFLASHYPAWSSGYHGAIDENGRCKERGNRVSQEIIMPMLKKYNATAMFAGHDHFYERSEPENGITMIITGGAGAPLRNKCGNAKKQNPYSKVFVKKYHYCLVTIDGDKCQIKAMTPKGEVIDTFQWNARK